MKSVKEIIDFIKLEVQEITLDKQKSSLISDDANFVNHLKMDSLDYAQLVLNAENFIQSKLDEDKIDWRKIQTVQTMAQALYDSQSL